MIKKFESFSKNILVIDVESTCLQDISEIIEIGISDTNKNFSDSILIKPEFSIINDFCTELTSLTDDYIQNFGKNYNEAYELLNKISSNYSVWASYGDYDKQMFEKMSLLYNIDIKLPKTHLNVREIFAKKILKSESSDKAPKNPKDALSLLSIEFEGFNHRGIDDAKNIAELLNILLDLK